MKWGALYGPEYANRLYAMVRRRTTGRLRFVCLTDDARGLRSEIECLPCPTVDLPMPYALRGWRKISLWGEPDRLFGLSGQWLFLDLDVVVTGPLDDFFTYQPEADYLVMQNWTQPGKGIGNTSVFRFRVGAAPYLLDALARRGTEILAAYPNSQTYVSREIRGMGFWPDPWCVLFKVQCVPPWPLRFWQPPRLPAGARVVAFPGVPNPHDAVRGHWPVKRAWKKSYKFIRPATWIEDHWVDAERALEDAK